MSNPVYTSGISNPRGLDQISPDYINSEAISAVANTQLAYRNRFRSKGGIGIGKRRSVLRPLEDCPEVRIRWFWADRRLTFSA